MKKFVSFLSLIFIFIFGCIVSSDTTFALSQRPANYAFKNEKTTIETIFENLDNANFHNYDISSEHHILTQKSGNSQLRIFQGNGSSDSCFSNNKNIAANLAIQTLYKNNCQIIQEKHFTNQTKPRAP